MLRLLRFAFSMLMIGGFGHAVIVRWAERTFPAIAARKRAARGVAIALTLLPVAARALTFTTRSPLAERLLAATMLEFIFAALGAVPLLGLEVLARVVVRRRATEASEATPPTEAKGALAPAGAVHATSPDAIDADAIDADAIDADASDASPRADGVLLTRRAALEGVGGLAVLGTTGAALGWGMVRGRHEFAVEEVPVRIAGLPRALDGYTIAQVSDIHVGLFVGDRELREGLDRVRALKPDLVVATGDLVDYDPRFVGQMARRLDELDPRDGVYAILGNHDYYTGADEVTRALAQTRVDLLMNAGRRIRPQDGGGFALLGVDDLWARQHGGAGPDLARATAMVPRDVPRILLAHQPTFFDRAVGQIALQLSGHTHGGQINPGIRPARLFLHYISGRYERDGSTLWVNRGFGVAGPPARICAPPEVTKIVLVAA